MQRYSKQGSLAQKLSALQAIPTGPVRPRSGGQLVPRIDPETDAAILANVIQIYEAGNTAGQVGRQCHMRKHRVLQLLHTAGVRLRHGEMSETEVVVCVQQYIAGQTIQQIADELELPRTTVQSALTREGVQMRRRGRQAHSD